MSLNIKGVFKHPVLNTHYVAIEDDSGWLAAVSIRVEGVSIREVGSAVLHNASAKPTFFQSCAKVDDVKLTSPALIKDIREVATKALQKVAN